MPAVPATTAPQGATGTQTASPGAFETSAVPADVLGAPAAPPDVLARPAGGALTLLFTTVPALLRLTVGLVGGVVALSVRTPPVDQMLLLPVVAALTAWSGWYALRALRRGVSTFLVVGDVVLTTATCLAIPVLVAPEVLPGEVSWTAVLASTTVINTQVTTAARWSVPAGVLITIAYATGAYNAGNSQEAIAHSATLLVQTGCAAVLAAVMRRRIARADRAFADHQRLARENLVARTAREAERRQNRDLHDTVLATLTMVGLGAGAVPTLRERCAADLRTLSALTEARSLPDGPVALEERLRDALTRLPGLAVTVDLTPRTVPAPVAEALTEATYAALSNVARHAPGATAALRLSGRDGTVVVEVVDDGPGFDPAAVPAHRYGLRESVCGRMAGVGGRAVVDSDPGAGTRIRLEWSDGD